MYTNTCKKKFIHVNTINRNQCPNTNFLKKSSIMLHSFFSNLASLPSLKTVTSPRGFKFVTWTPRFISLFSPLLAYSAIIQINSWFQVANPKSSLGQALNPPSGTIFVPDRILSKSFINYAKRVLYLIGTPKEVMKSRTIQLPTEELSFMIIPEKRF